jgi:hypothetical protein
MTTGRRARSAVSEVVAMTDSEMGGSDLFDYPNEGEIIEDPAFLCELCGYANVHLVEIRGRAAAKCTNCGAGYLTTETDREGGR